MAQKIKDIMTKSPVALSADRPISEAAVAMKERGIGDVIVLKDDQMCGVVTDRDLAVRVLAEGRDPKNTKLGDVCTRDPVSLTPDDDVEEAVRLVRERAIRRIPVVEKGKPVGIVSMGDLAMERDQKSALADVSAAAPNN